MIERDWTSELFPVNFGEDESFALFEFDAFPRNDQIGSDAGKPH